MILKEFDQNAARLIPNIIEMESELELSTYTISEWDLVHFEDGKAKHKIERGWERFQYDIMFFLQMMRIKVSIISMILQNSIVGSC